MGTELNGDDMMNSDKDKLFLPSGGYRKLKSFQLARLIYDITVHFVDLYIPSQSRTCDQMVQAARSGVQNIAEGSVAAATSIKTEIRLYNVAKASLVELQLDYQDFLRQHNSELWVPSSMLYQNFVARRIDSKKSFREFIQWAEFTVANSVPIRSNPFKSVLVANGAVLLIDAATFFSNGNLTANLKYF